MKLTVSSFVCVALLAGCERQPPARPSPRAPSPAPALPAPSARAASPAASLDGGAAPEAPPRLPQPPEALAAYARIDAGVPSAAAGPNPITGHPRR